MRGVREMTEYETIFEQEVAECDKWFKSARYEGKTRPYASNDVVALRGTFPKVDSLTASSISIPQCGNASPLHEHFPFIRRRTPPT